MSKANDLGHGSVSSRKSRKVGDAIVWQLMWPLHHLFFPHTNPSLHPPSLGFPYDSPLELCSPSPFSVPSCHFIKGDLHLPNKHTHAQHNHLMGSDSARSEFFSNIDTESRRKKSALSSGIMRDRDQLILELHQPIFPPARESPSQEEVNTKERKAEMGKDRCLLVKLA